MEVPEELKQNPQHPSEDQHPSSSSEALGAGSQELHDEASPGAVLVLPENGETPIPTQPLNAVLVGTPQIHRVFPIRIQQLRKREPLSTPADTPTSSSPPVGSDGESTFQDPLGSIHTYGQAAGGVESSQIITEQRVQAVSKSGKFYLTNRFNYFSGNHDDGGSQRRSSSGANGEDTSAGVPVSTLRDTGYPTSSANGPGKAYRCEDEPIHIPGAIQRFGALITIRESPKDVFTVRIVSDNSKDITGLDPEALFDLRCFTDILVESDKREFIARARARSRRTWTAEDDARTNPDVYTISLTSLIGTPRPVFCAIHCNKGSDLIICEFEPKTDVFRETAPALPETPISVTDYQVFAPEDVKPSMTKSKPLKLNSESGRQLGSMELFYVLCEMQAQLAGATTLSELLDITVGLVYELTAFHRVMVYQFDETNAGRVVAEYFNSKASTDSYLNLHFPASDIPKQARDLYVVNKIRLLYDRDEETARLVCRTLDDAEPPLDLKHSYLRAMSPIHIKYLHNMGVKASMSISLMFEGKLWGLISCHNYGSGMRVTLPVRELCRSLGEHCSTHIEKLIYAARIQVRKPLSVAPKKTSPTSFIAASSADLLTMFDADFGFLAIKGEARTIGKISAYSEAIALLQYIRQRMFTEIFATQNVRKDCADLQYDAGFQVLAGMLVVPLAVTGVDFLVLFRKAKLKEVLWAGNPHEKMSRSGSAYLEPRSSFMRWTEQVVGSSREWSEDQVESAAVLSTLFGRFIEVWRQKDSIVQKNRMTRLLIQNAGHEVRTPLNSIINYLEVALEEPLDERARQHLHRSLQASKSLVFVVNDLLSLTEVEDVEFKIHKDNVNLKQMISEVITAFEDESARRRLNILLHADEKVPNLVRCDPAALRQVLSNLLTNAIEHGCGNTVKIELSHISSTDGNTLVEVAFHDEGDGLTESELDSIFQDLEQVLDDDEVVSEQSNDIHEHLQIPRPKSIGLGLAFTARFVRLNYGQITMASEPKKGTRVSIKIPFLTALEVKMPAAKPAIQLPLPTPPSDKSHIQPPSKSVHGTGADGMFEDLSIQDVSSALQTANSESAASTFTMIPSGSEGSRPPVPSRYPFPEVEKQRSRFSVLIAEDNPLNSRLLETRLTKRGHTVKVTVDGQACADTFCRNPDAYDVILMDLQMPLVDGAGSTRLIRQFERENSPSVSSSAFSYGRIPIIAVSASLIESALDEYLGTGFDGWVLKPIDFQRLEAILAAMQDRQMRESLLYGQDTWDRGGWFKFKAFKGIS